MITLAKQSAGVASLVKLGREKRYELVCCSSLNAFFVDAAYFELFQIEDNSLDALRPDGEMTTYLFVGYDGHVFLAGNRTLYWHSMPIEERRVQHLPRFFQRYPDDYSSVQRLAFRVYRRLQQHLVEHLR